MQDAVFVQDGNHLLHRCYFTVKPKVRSVESAITYSFLSILFRDALAVRANHILVAFDGAEVFRYKIFPSYKANRSDHGGQQAVREGFKDVYEYLPFLLSTLTELGIAWVQPRTFEADDVMASAAFSYQSFGKVFCGTRDKDSYQFVNERCFLYDSTNKVHGKPKPLVIDAGYVQRKKGVPPSRMRALQTLLGDKIDNIPQILTPSKALRAVRTHATLSEAIKNDEFLQKHTLDLKRNAQLVTLRTDVPMPPYETLKPQKTELPNERKENLPKSYFAFLEFAYPKSKGLFG